MALGSLVVEVAANVARFQSDMGKVAQIAENNARQMDKAFGIVTKSLQALGGAFVMGLTFDKVKDKIEGVVASAAGLQQLAERTGATVENLSGLAAVAKLSGTDTDSLATGLQKLSKSMVDAETGGTKTTAAFKSIGIGVADLQGKKPDEVFLKIAKSLDQYQDGAEKTALAQTLLGKAGANLLPVMNDLAATGEYQVKVTDEQARAADEYEKNVVRLQAAQNAIFKTIGLELVPVMDAFTKALLDAATANDGLRKGVSDLAKDGSIREWAEGAAKAAAFVIDAFDGVVRIVTVAGKNLGALGAAAVAVAHGEFGQARQIMADFDKDAQAILTKTFFSDRLAKQLEESHKPQPTRDSTRKKLLAPVGDQTGQDDPARKIMEGRLRELDAFITAEKTLLGSREQMIDHFRGLDYMTLRDAETKKQALMQDSLAKTLDAYDKEIAAAQAYAAHTTKLTDRQDAMNRIADIRAKRAAAEVAANQALIDSQLKLAAVQRQFDLATADRARNDAIANQTAQFQIDLMGKGTLEVQKATAARQIQLALDERIYQLKKLDQNADTSAAVAQAAVQTAQATALIEAQWNRQRDAIFGAHDALQKYAEDATNVGADVANALSNSFKGMEDALTSFVTTGKLDFKSLADSIVADITRMVIKAQIMAPLANWLQGGIGGGTGGNNPSAYTAGAGGWFGSILGALFGGGRASGGPVSAGMLYEINERKMPEVASFGGRDYLLTGGQSGRVTPMQGGNSVSVTVVQQFAPGTNRATTLQAAADARRQLEFAGRNI